jgi:hypothetical protein
MERLIRESANTTKTSALAFCPDFNPQSTSTLKLAGHRLLNQHGTSALFNGLKTVDSNQLKARGKSERLPESIGVAPCHDRG